MISIAMYAPVRDEHTYTQHSTLIEVTERLPRDKLTAAAALIILRRSEVEVRREYHYKYKEINASSYVCS